MFDLEQLRIDNAIRHIEALKKIVDSYKKESNYTRPGFIRFQPEIKKIADKLIKK